MKSNIKYLIPNEKHASINAILHDSFTIYEAIFINIDFAKLELFTTPSPKDLAFAIKDDSLEKR
jgi:hypothetical protein